MPSKRTVPEQREVEERLVRLAAAKDAEIAGLRGIASARLATIEALRADHATEIALLKADFQNASDAADAYCAEIAALTEQRDRAMDVVATLSRLLAGYRSDVDAILAELGADKLMSECNILMPNTNAALDTQSSPSGRGGIRWLKK
jgi:hypothetical protein